jgi:hypothetical protein
MLTTKKELANKLRLQGGFKNKMTKQIDWNTQKIQLLPDLNYYYYSTTKGHNMYLQFSRNK